MKIKILRWAGIATVLLIGSAIGGAIMTARRADASRNSSGSYTLYSPGNPAVTNQVISTSLWNNTFGDIATALSDSLSRSGQGGMTAALRGADGSVSSPAYSWTNETGSGYYRIGAGDYGLSILGTKTGEWTANGLRVANGAVATPSLSFFNDTGAGLYRIGSNNIGFAINGAKISEWAAGGFTTTVASVNGGITLLTGNTANFTSYALGRAASEFQIGISNGSNGYCVGTSAGDTCLVTSAGTKTIFLDTNGGVGTPSLKVVAGNGGVVVAGGLTSDSVTSTGAVTATRTILTKTSPTYGVTVNIDASLGTLFVVAITNNTAFTIANPTNSATGQKITILLKNTSGGSTGNISVGANYRGSSNLLINTNNQYAIYEYIYDGTLWYQVSAPAQFAL